MYLSMYVIIVRSSSSFFIS